jgi:hypothetical protein
MAINATGKFDTHLGNITEQQAQAVLQRTLGAAYDSAFGAGVITPVKTSVHSSYAYNRDVRLVRITIDLEIQEP